MMEKETDSTAGANEEMAAILGIRPRDATAPQY